VPDPPPPLLAPLHPTRSVVTPADGARYTEVDGVAVLCLVDDRSVHVLTADGAALWGQLDGRRSLGEIRAGLGVVDPTSRADATVELVRRLRAVGLVRDVDPSGPPVHLGRGEQPGRPSRPPTVHLLGAVASTAPVDRAPAAGPATILRLGRAPRPDVGAPPALADAETEAETETETKTVAVSFVDDRPQVDGRPVAGLEVRPRPPDGSGSTGPGGDALDALDALVQATTDDDLRRDGTLDLLAALAELVRPPDPDPHAAG